MSFALLGLLNLRLGTPYSNNLKGAAAILGVQFNNWLSEKYLNGSKPDPSNEQIAMLVARGIQQTRLPAFLQSEHAVILERYLVPVAQKYPSTSEMHIPTHTYLKWAAECVRKLNKGNKVIIYGHPDHLRRITCLARYYGLNPIVPRTCRQVPYANCELPGDQWWARTRNRYIPWEYLSRGVLLLYWLFRRL